MKKHLLLLSVIIVSFVATNAQNLYPTDPIYYGSFEVTTAMWIQGENATTGLTVSASTDKFVHGQRSLSFHTDNASATAIAAGSNALAVSAILGGTDDYAVANVPNVSAGDYTFKFKLYVEGQAPTGLIFIFQESTVGITGTGHTWLQVPIGSVAKDSWQDIEVPVTLPAYAAMKTGFRVLSKDYSDDGTDNSAAIYIDNIELIEGAPTSTGSVTNSSFRVYPNPASDQVFIEVEDGSIIEICNVAGSVVKSLVATSNKQSISVADLAKGMYVIKVTTDGNSQTTKLLVK